MLTNKGDEIVDEAMTWLNTPYHHRQRAKSLGVDCAGLIIAVGQKVGADVKDILHYSNVPDGISLTSEMNKQLEKHPILEKGTIVSLAIESHPQHLAIYDGENHIIHANSSIIPELNQVIRTRFKGYWASLVVGRYRYKWLS